MIATDLECSLLPIDLHPGLHGFRLDGIPHLPLDQQAPR